MGCDCDINLPYNVRVRDVATVLAILAGKSASLEPISERCQSPVVRVKGVRIETTCVPEMVIIIVEGPLGEASKAEREQGDDGLFSYYHFECESSGGGRLLGGRSNAFWIAAGKALVDFFGGKVDYNDCDSKDVDYRKRARPNRENCPSDGKAWEDFQRRIAAVKPLTDKDFKGGAA